MRTFVWTLCTVIALLLISSCDKKDKNYSLGEFRINIATAIPKGENIYSLILDDGTTLWPAASERKYQPATNQRVFVNYTILSDAKDGYDHFVKVNDIWNILTKDIIKLTAQNEDSIGNDPVEVNYIWVGNDYLNIDFMFNYGGVRPHAINLVKNTLSTATAPDVIDLEFRHNAYRSSRSKFYEGFVCFNLKPLRVAGTDSVKLAIKVKTLNETKTYNAVYRYNSAIRSSTTEEVPIPIVASKEYY